MDQIFGYDLICYDDSIEFAMEFCEQALSTDKGDTMKKELFENLKLMHTLKMVHRDMKELNIGWSSYF